MVGRVYRWRGGYWRVVCRWSGRGPRNVLIERVEPTASTNAEGWCWWPVAPGERVVRPFRGLRRADR